jgi:CRP-like cAMP-binding protein
MVLVTTLQSEWRPQWRAMLEQIYQGRSLYNFAIGQEIPLYSHIIWVVCRGVVQLSTLHPSGDEVLLGFVSHSMPFGSSLSLMEPYQAIARSNLDLMRFNLTEIEQSHQLTLEMFRHLRRRLQQSEAMLALVNHRRVEDRLRHLLLLLKQEIGQPAQFDNREGTRLIIRLTHQDLANAIGSTRVTITRVLGQLQQEGWLTIDCYRHIILLAEA